MYLPLAAIVAALVIGGAALLQRLFAGATRRVTIAGAAAVAVGALLLAGATLARNEDYRSHAALWRDVIAKRPSNPRACLNLARALEGQPPPVRLETFRALVRAHPSAAGHAQLGILENRAGHRLEAERAFRAAIQLDPRSAGAHANLGTLQLRRGDAAGAARSFEQAAVLEPGMVSYHAELGRAHLALGDLEGAARALEQAMRLQPRHAASHSYLARVRWAQQRRADALVHFRRAAALDAHNADLHNQLGVALGESGDLAGAVAAFRAAAALRPADRRLRRNLELTLERLARPASTRPRR